MQINLLVFDGAPEALGEDVIESTAAAGHALVDYDATATTGWDSIYRKEFGLKMPY